MDTPPKQASGPCPPPCGPPVINAIEVALVVLIAIVLIYYLCRFVVSMRPGHRDRFVSSQARVVAARAREVFADGGGSQYTKYRAGVPDADPVQYSDVRRLWREGRLTPENVQDVL